MGGGHKLLAPLRGVPIVRLSVSAAVDADIGPVTVVTGAEASSVKDALTGLDVQIVHEPAFEEGISASIRRGLSAIQLDSAAIVVALGDQPLVRPHAYRHLAAVWRETAAAIVVPRYSHQTSPSHPILFDARVFDELRALRGDTGAREIVSRDPHRVSTATLDWDAPIDVDTHEDLARLSDA